jgi:hypothetical protein
MSVEHTAYIHIYYIHTFILGTPRWEQQFQKIKWKLEEQLLTVVYDSWRNLVPFYKQFLVWKTVRKLATKGTKTAVKDIRGFVCASLGSSTVQLDDSLGRSACACSDAAFSCQNGNCQEICFFQVWISLVLRFLAICDLFTDDIKLYNVMFVILNVRVIQH